MRCTLPRVISVGSGGLKAASVLPELIEHFRERYPLVVTSRTALRGEIEEWLKYPVSELDVVATMNLIGNAPPLAERGIACVMCVEGAVDMFDPARFAFRPLKPELSMTSVLAWKKLSPYAGAAGKFLEYIKSIHSEHTEV